MPQPETPPDSGARFWNRVIVGGPDECWEWQGARDSSKYGVVGLAGVHWRTHRYAWSEANGPIPAGLFVLHRCDNPPCVNPAHLWIGTHQDNMDDMTAKGRNGIKARPELAARGERAGNVKLTEDDVREIRRLSAEGLSQRKIATRFGIRQPSVHLIVKRKRWAHV